MKLTGSSRSDRFHAATKFRTTISAESLIVGNSSRRGGVRRLSLAAPSRKDFPAMASRGSEMAAQRVQIGGRRIDPARRWAMQLDTGSLVFVNTDRLVAE